jgi:hypothetical protein
VRCTRSSAAISSSSRGPRRAARPRAAARPARPRGPPAPLGPRLAPDQLRVALGLLARVGAQLLRGDERVVQRAIALAERAQLLVEVARLLLQLLIDAHQPLELRGDLLAELLHTGLVVAAQRRPKS